ncbi:helix-turn-helix domain-containing protein [Streptomyces samsunensis]|uniref:telomere-protecting terminal protein Tpg n=1 Tax=Streptomyces malaysiensis TaxID=92644 RepID=UPI001581D145|nr:helix-turn-helix domain-containing protein [Streptomyces samsunensis]NUH42862.1 helix-turn-helix domain-containing protein [Streptomyces samsunensis]
MTDIHDALERAENEVVTRQPPKTPLAQIRLLMRAEKGSTKAVASRLGVSQRTVERYLAGQRKNPRKPLAAALVREVAKAWQPRVKRRRRQEAAASKGLTVETRARFGYTAPIGTTDDPRMRRLTVHLPPEYARPLLNAQDQGASDQELRGIVARGLQDIYFRDNGRRADNLEVELTDIDYIDVSFND